MKSYNLIAAAALAATLAGCGGGGGGDVPAAVSAPVTASSTTDKYVGSWNNCAPVTGATNGVLSAYTIFTFTKTSDTVVGFTVSGEGFQAANCAGPVFNTISSIAAGNITVKGTKLVGSVTVDKLDFVSVSRTIPLLNGSRKDIGFISANTLKFGATSVPDAEGYLTALDNTFVLSKR